MRWKAKSRRCTAGSGVRAEPPPSIDLFGGHSPALIFRRAAAHQRFELCYGLADSRPPAWLAPQWLPPAKPAALQGRARPEDLVLRYAYDFMPKGMLSRLTVRMHRFH